jgi:GntR family transcriptional regulator, transcriptional repressor for pyruvate dehydrogenase complex
MWTKIPRATLAEQAARNLRAFIESQELKPGKLLPPEYQLAADLGVSRPIIREALKSLEGQGIIEVVSGKGAMVKLPDSQPLQLFFQRSMGIQREAIIDVMELRIGVEIQSAALAAQRRTPDDIARLTESVAEMRRNLCNPDAYVELDVAFHLLIASTTRNTMIYHMVKAIRESLKDTLHESLLRQQTEEQLELVQAGHEAILAGLEQGDAEGAKHAMAAHFDEAVMSLVYGAIGNSSAADESSRTDDD